MLPTDRELFDWDDRRAEQHLQPIAWNALVPLDSWGPQAQFPPHQARDRYDRLTLYRSLYDGSNRDRPTLSANYYRRSVDFLADLMAAYPPILEGVADDDFTTAVNDALVEVAWSLGCDQNRYGTTILRPALEDDKPTIQVLDPAAWFPSTDPDVSVYVQFGDDLGDGPTTIEIQVMHPSAWIIETYSFGTGTIGEMLSSTSADGPDEDVVFPLPRPPTADRRWGTGLFEPMIPLVRELERRATQTSRILDMHANPLLVFKRGAQDQIHIPGSGGVGGDMTVRAETLWLSETRQHAVSILPDALESAEYLTWDGQLQGAMSHVRHTEDALFSATGIPAALYAADRSALASGTALKRIFAPTYVRLHSTQQRAIPRLLDIIRLLGRMAGVDADDASLAWDNPLDHLDTQTILQTSDPDADPDAVGFEIPEGGDDTD